VEQWAVEKDEDVVEPRGKEVWPEARTTAVAR
jgi:hypothetical protein